MRYRHSDGHTGLGNQPVGDEVERGGIRFQLSLLKTSDSQADFVVHADPRFGSLSTDLQPENVLARLGFQPFQPCPILTGRCYYLHFAESHLDARRRGDIHANRPIHEAYRRFLEYFPDLVKTMMDIDLKLRMAGFDIFPWEGVGMKPWDVTSGEKELFVPPEREHEAYVKIRELVEHATQLLRIADPYVDRTLFQLLHNVASGVRIEVLTREVPKDFALELGKFRTEGHTIDVRVGSRAMHDRFVDADAVWYHLGASIKDAGAKAFVMSRLEDPGVIAAVNRVIEDAWQDADQI